MKHFLLLCLAVILVAGCLGTGNLDRQSYKIGFYNVENLFDTYDDPNKPDEEFLPEGKKQWTTERYETKLDRIEQVIDGMEYPALLGLCEVESFSPLLDLTQRKELKKRDYHYVHFDSPDYRGIDNALLYRKKHFKYVYARTIEINFPKEIVEDYTTRDILHVCGLLPSKDTLHVFVNHWPSRRGGLEASEPKRVYVAQQLRTAVDEILDANPRANVLLMGDFNDETDNRSVREALGAQPLDLELSSGGELFNAHAGLDEVGVGTYNYRGNWNMLDQIIVSGALVNGAGGYSLKNAGVFKRDWLMYESEKYGETPNRTYGGPNYYGGYSDHLPVYVELGKE